MIIVLIKEIAPEIGKPTDFQKGIHVEVDANSPCGKNSFFSF